MNQNLKYSDTTLLRAQKALSCSPFQLNLFSTMADESVSLQSIIGQTGIEKGYTFNALGEQQTEQELIWLINVGVLRREVDGQGITDSFRLTPLGRQLVETWKSQGGCFPTASWLDKLTNYINRSLQFFI